MSADQSDGRISVSVSTLRAELTSLELRLVDRLNAALEGKADKAMQDQLQQRVSDMQTRVQSLEGNTVKREGPFVQQLEQNALDISNLKSVAGYKKWLWAQTVALAAIAIPLVAWGIDRLTQ